jgi:hypothetical protein
MGNRPLYVLAGFVVAVQLGCTAYVAHRLKIAEHGPMVVMADTIPQVLWDGSNMSIDFVNGPASASAPVDFELRVTLTRPAAETLFRNLAQIHGARPRAIEPERPFTQTP